MANFFTFGTTDQLQIKIPVKKTTGWANQLRDEFFKKVVEHDHTGNGKGAQITAASLIDDGINGSKLRLLNNEYLRSRNAADSADVNIIRVNTNNEIEFGAPVAQFVASVTQTGTITSSNAAVILTNNTITAAMMITANMGTTILYRIVRGTEMRSGELEVIGSNVSDEYIGDDMGVIFAMNGSVLEATVSDNTNDAILTFIRVEK